ncbi:MAG TPA: ABC transporter permease [Candidatus Saccharimonadales bacterium]|nr:ABC transporter permease [Candidatus Saccharimonadales bacterium]
MQVLFAYSLKNLMARRGTTAFAAGGIALVVLVFVSVLMLGEGFRRTLVSTGSPDNAIVLRSGATSELVSAIARDLAPIIKTQPEVATDSDGRPVAAAEMIFIININRRGTRSPSNVVVRGVEPESVQMRPVRIIEGRMWRPGLSEVIAGKLISEKFEGCRVGERVHMGGRDWDVVGVFDAGGTAFESEIWGDSEQTMAAIRRGSYSSVTVRLRDPNGVGSLRERLAADPRFNVQVKSEKTFYVEQSRNLLLFIYILGIFVTVVFSLAAILAAMLTMFATIGARTAEIGTLRALGFSRASILLAFVAESVLLGLMGGVAGVVPGFALRQISFSTTNFASFSEVAWKLSFTPAIALTGLLFAATMGFLGGLIPAVRASRIPIVDSLREA